MGEDAGGEREGEESDDDDDVEEDEEENEGATLVDGVVLITAGT